MHRSEMGCFYTFVRGRPTHKVRSPPMTVGAQRLFSHGERHASAGNYLADAKKKGGGGECHGIGLGTRAETSLLP